MYFTYTEDKPISFNPCYTDDYIFDVGKKDSIKTLLLTLWKSEDDKVTKTESDELGSALSPYIERIQSDRSIVPSFNTCLLYTSRLRRYVYPSAGECGNTVACPGKRQMQ